MTRVGVLLFAGSLAACGGAAAPAESPSTAPAETPASVGPAQPNQADSSQDDRAPTLAAARGELDRAERDVEAAPSDCASACRALSSMASAAEHLCALERGGECTRARERVDSARARVVASCGECQP